MNHENKNLKIIIYIIMLIIAIGGPIIAYNTKEESWIEPQDKTEYDDDRYEDDRYYDDDEYYEQEETVINLDKYLDKYTYTVTEEDKLKLINSTNLRRCMSDTIYGEMFKENISDEFKLLYTLNELVRFIGEKEPNTYLMGSITISKSTLLEEARKIFYQVNIPDIYNSQLYYYGTSNISCGNTTCTFTQSTFGLTGITPIDGYETKIVNNTSSTGIIHIKKIYVDEEFIDYNEETNIYKFNAKLYNSHNGELLKTIENYELDLSNSETIDVYELFSPHYDKINEYVYSFDDNNRLLSVTDMS